jgi:hypothetical protein
MKILMQVLNRLTIMLSLQALVLAISISLALAADVEFIDAALSLLHPNVPPDAKILAQKVTTTLLPQLIGSDDQLRQRLGFSSLAQTANLLLVDPPFRVFRVGLSKLKNFQPTSLTSLGALSLILGEENWFMFPPSTHPVSPVRFLFPIREASRPPLGCTPPSPADPPAFGCIASSIQVKWLRDTHQWEFQQIGRPGLIKKLTQFGNGDTHLVIWIPVLNLHYLVRFEGSVLMIKAIAEDRYVKDPDTGNLLKPGQELLGDKVFDQLREEVQHIDPNGPPG